MFTELKKHDRQGVMEMKQIGNSKGLTLIELIVSIAILGIVIVAFLTMFTSAFNGIVQSGHRADAAYSSQQEMTSKLIDKDSIDESLSITYDFIGGPDITIEVSIMEAETTINGNVSIMKSFIPKP